MANPAKQAGTAEETKTVRRFEAAGLRSRRWENGAPGRDVDVDADRLRVIEVKRRANLNVHATLKNTLDRWPSHPAAVVWHRLSRKGDNVKRTPDGPTLVALPLDDYVDLLVLAKAATALARSTVFDGVPFDLRDVTSCMETVREAVAVIDAKYPEE